MILDNNGAPSSSQGLRIGNDNSPMSPNRHSSPIRSPQKKYRKPSDYTYGPDSLRAGLTPIVSDSLSPVAQQMRRPLFQEEKIVHVPTELEMKLENAHMYMDSETYTDHHLIMPDVEKTDIAIVLAHTMSKVEVEQFAARHIVMRVRCRICLHFQYLSVIIFFCHSFYHQIPYRRETN
jgi:hypothetical protein